jgi:hypothetical protein
MREGMSNAEYHEWKTFYRYEAWLHELETKGMR